MKSPGQLKRLPQHVAIIMDGNGRWARQRGLPRLVGHKQGATTAQHVVEVFVEYKIPYLTLYAFSTENWNRPQREIRGLFRLLEQRLDEGISLAQKEGIKVRHLGKLDGLSPRIQDTIRRALEATRRLIIKGIPAQDVDETVVGQYLYTAGIPDPDLIIRTGGEMRLSNFLTWQSAYAEIYFTPVLWPDFDKKEIDKALTIFSQRQRRFGSLAPE